MGGLTLPVGDRPSELPAAPAYLLVFDQRSTRVFELPRVGEVLIGRGDGASVPVQDAAASRLHAKVVLRGDEARISDLDSQNGTFVNGEPVVGSRVLVSGDTITIAGVSLVFHAGARRPAAHAVADFGRFRERADEEAERSKRFGRPLALIELRNEAGLDREAVLAALGAELRPFDALGGRGARSVVLLLAETGAVEAAARAQRILELLAPLGPVKAGVAVAPDDGTDVDTLLASARSAAAVGAEGGVALASHAFQTRQLGERRLILAEPAMLRIFALVDQVATTDLPLVIQGETGTGKDLVAAALHQASARRKGPFVTINCAAIPENLVESELFGYERGAFSGAVGAKQGLLASADGGTVFLDEIGELRPDVQAKLLRVLETKRLTRLGSVREQTVDFRIVAATHRSLAEEQRAGRFREDLFFRLAGATVWLPPLRDRTRELPLLAQAFLKEACARGARRELALSSGAKRALAAYSWPGNVRQLRSFIEFAAAVVQGPSIEAHHFEDWQDMGRPDSAPRTAPLPTDAPASPPVEAVASPPAFRPIDDEVRELERSRMAAALTATHGSRSRAAELIKMPRRTFATKMKLYGLGDIKRDDGSP